MMDLAILMIQMACVVFLAWGGVLSLLSVVRSGTWGLRAAGMKVSATPQRTILSRRNTVAAI